MFLDVGQQSRRFTPAHALQLLMLTFCVIFSAVCSQRRTRRVAARCSPLVQMFLDVGQQSRRFTPAHALQLLMLTFCVIFSETATVLHRAAIANDSHATAHKASLLSVTHAYFHICR
mmetsp:Transcript_100384/g.161823  ORF Transcript_100384/g.161823 Transcript_100384/m.161823 type:complete len:117 (-) Transcript_100384:40-390(-)